MSMSVFAKLAELEDMGPKAALCTVIDVKGSTPRKPGAKMIVLDTGEPFGKIFGTIGGGAIEHQIRNHALNSIRLAKSSLITTSLRNELGMCCGGEMTIFIEPVLKKPNFICFGAGHIAQALCPLLGILGFQLWVVDERADLLLHQAFASATKKQRNTSTFSLTDLPFGDNAFVVIATHDHDLDQQIVEGILHQPFKYAALVGSQRKALMTRKRLIAKDFNLKIIDRLICPAGLMIHGQTPEEIALSIAAQIIAVKNGSSSEEQ
jgi:xanthine dehydrogenase accessory factor